MEQKLETLRKEIIKANPSIMDLKFGCRIKHTLYGNVSISTVALASGMMMKNENGVAVEDYPFLDVFEGGEKKRLNRDIDMFEILGREIRLADVLLAVGNISSDYSIDATGRFQVWKKVGLRWCKDGNGLALSWNLSHDSLDWHAKNAPETIEFLYSLFKK